MPLTRRGRSCAAPSSASPTSAASRRSCCRAATGAGRGAWPGRRRWPRRCCGGATRSPRRVRRARSRASPAAGGWGSRRPGGGRKTDAAPRLGGHRLVVVHVPRRRRGVAVPGEQVAHGLGLAPERGHERRAVVEGLGDLVVELVVQHVQLLVARAPHGHGLSRGEARGLPQHSLQQAAARARRRFVVGVLKLNNRSFRRGGSPGWSSTMKLVLLLLASARAADLVEVAFYGEAL